MFFSYVFSGGAFHNSESATSSDQNLIGATSLLTHKADVDQMNESKLAALSGNKVIGIVYINLVCLCYINCVYYDLLLLNLNAFWIIVLSHTLAAEASIFYLIILH